MVTIKQRKIIKSLSNFQDTIVILQVKSNLQSHPYFKQAHLFHFRNFQAIQSETLN